MQPSVVSEVPRTAYLASNECFSPLASIFAVDDIVDAIELANATTYWLSSANVTNSMDAAIKAVKGIKAERRTATRSRGFDWS